MSSNCANCPEDSIQSIVVDSLKRTADQLTDDHDNKDSRVKRLRVDASASLPSQFEIDLQCPVCQDMPTELAFQCINGHVICDGCLNTIMQLPKSLCPHCRSDFRVAKAKRHLMAETMIKLLKIPCPHDECTMVLSAKDLKQHRDHECPFRPVACRFQMLGCSFTDIPLNRRSEHEQNECQFCVDDRALALFSLTYHEKVQREQKLQDDLDKMTESYVTVRSECLQTHNSFNHLMQQYHASIANCVLYESIKSTYLCNPAVKDSCTLNLYFSSGLVLPNPADQRKVAYSVKRFMAFGWHWIARLILVCKTDSVDQTNNVVLSTRAVGLYLSLCPIGHSGKAGPVDSLYVGISRLSATPNFMPMPFRDVWMTQPYDPTTVSLTDPLHVSHLPKLSAFDVQNKTIAWTDVELQRARFFDLTQNCSRIDKAGILNIWNHRDIVPVLRLMMLNTSNNVKPTKTMGPSGIEKYKTYVPTYLL